MIIFVLLTLSSLMSPCSDLYTERHGTGTARRLASGVSKLVEFFVNETTRGPKLCHVTSILAVKHLALESIVFVRFLLLFQRFFHLWKWRVLCHRAVPHVYLLVTLQRKLPA